MKKIFLLVFVFLFSISGFSALTNEQRAILADNLNSACRCRISKLVIQLHDIRALGWLMVI